MNGNIIVSLQNINVSYGENSILENLNLEIKDKEFLTLLGPSGCGKTTILRTIAGFIKPDSGKVFFDGKVINDMPAYKREVNTVFQRYALFPHLNVFENIAFGLNLKKVNKSEIKERVYFLCRICLYNKKINRLNLQVHHIESLQEDYSKRLDNDNLITLCQNCHEQAEKGHYTKDFLKKLIKAGVNIPPYV